MTQEQGDDDKEKDPCNETLQALWSDGGREMGECAQVMGEVYVNNNKNNNKNNNNKNNNNKDNNKWVTMTTATTMNITTKINKQQ